MGTHGLECILYNSLFTVLKKTDANSAGFTVQN